MLRAGRLKPQQPQLAAWNGLLAPRRRAADAAVATHEQGDAVLWTQLLLLQRTPLTRLDAEHPMLARRPSAIRRLLDRRRRPRANPDPEGQGLRPVRC